MAEEPKRRRVPGDPELAAIRTIGAALEKLDQRGRMRVLGWVVDRYGRDAQREEQRATVQAIDRIGGQSSVQPEPTA